jgi:hypothetical protein
MVDVQTLLEVFFKYVTENCLFHSLIKLFCGIKKTSNHVTNLFNLQITWISDLLGVRWKEFCCTCIAGKQHSVYDLIVFRKISFSFHEGEKDSDLLWLLNSK